MSPNQPSAHVKVGLVLTQVRGEFLRASTSDPEGPARAAKALRRGFGLLNCCPCCYRCRPCHDSAAGGHCEGFVEKEEEDQLLEASHASVDPGVDGHGEERTDRMALREAFLESSYLPFASLLLREVGPTWLPIWDSVPAVSGDRLGTRGAATSPAISVLDGGPSEVAPASAAARAAVSQGDGSGTETRRATPHPRSLFEAFFRPPAVPPSLALSALCDGLGRQVPEATTTRQLTLAYQLDGGGGGGGEGALAARGTPAPDPRAVQHICRLLEPYLQAPSYQQQHAVPDTARPNSRASQSMAAVMGKLSIDGGSVGAGTPGAAPASEQHQRDRASLLTQAVMDLAGGISSDQGEGSRSRRARQGNDEEAHAVAARHTPPPLFVGGDAAGTLASALCLAPQRVANSLGPIAPPGFAPAVFFPAVCGGVLRAILTLCSKRAKASMPHAAGDVWREFTGRLLTAGRADDLANAWLGAMLAERREDRQEDRVDGSKTAAEGEAAAPWEAWAEDAGGAPEAHAWMMTRLLASRRKSFTEALLRALWPRDGRRRADPGTWPPGFRTAACRVLVGRPLLSTTQRHEHPAIGEEGDGHGAVMLGGESELSADVSVGLVERLLLQRPLPPPAAEVIAKTLAWCDRRSSCVAGSAGARERFGAPAEGRGGDAGGGRDGGLLIGALKRVAAVWAEPSFLNRSPLRQQEFYTRFLLAALRSGDLGGQLGGADGDQEALVVLIRGVGSHLDVPARETRLRGMRVGEAVAELEGQSLRFDELDGEREEQQRRQKNDYNSNGEDKNGVEEGEAGMVAAAAAVVAEAGEGVSAGGREIGNAGERRKKPRKRKGSKGRKRDKGDVAEEEEKKRRRPQRFPAGWGGGDDGDSDLDPDMLLPLGGVESGSDSDAESMIDEAGDPDSNSEEDRHSSSSSGGCSGSSSEDDSWSGGDKGGYGNGGDSLGGAGRGEFSLGGAEDGDGDDDDDDSLEAYDLWDDQDDLAKVVDPMYLDQLIELLRSRDKPETVDKHETALKCAEQLIRRNPPDLAHRAPELSRDLLYLENSYDLEGFEALRSGALVATTAAAPESCAMYLGSELWGTGATEGTKLQILDVLVQAASELAGWARRSAGDGGGGGGSGVGPGGEHPSSSGESYPSALMQEAKGACPQGSVRRQQQQQQESSSTRVAAAAAAAATVASTNSTKRPESDSVTAVSSSRRADGMSMSARGTTRRWGYRRGPREQLRRNLFGRFAPVFFYPLAQGMVLRLRQSSTSPQPSSAGQQHPSEAGRTIAAAAAAVTAPDMTPYTLPSATSPPPPPSPLFAARLLHCLTCLVELCGNCPATPALAADLLGLAWLLRGAASDSRELRRAVLIAVATGVERSKDGAASGAVQGQQGEFLRWLQACAQGSDGATRELAGAVLGHSSVQALAYM